jgi:predicted O-linked N-acetylglucosamine transferase (SPINDLY family)
MYRQILQIDPSNPDALHLLGEIAYRYGHYDAAIELIRKAIGLNPFAAPFHCNLGAVYKAQGRLGEARTSYLRALELQPAFPEVHNNLGVILKEQGRLDEAIACYRQSISQKSDYAVAHNNLGAALAQQGKLEEAIASYRQALRIWPQYAEAYNNLGNALHRQKRLDEAVASFQESMRLRPEDATTHNNLGVVLEAQGRLDEAVNAYNRALALRPNFATAHNNLGVVLLAQGRVDEAAASYRRALACQPDYVRAHNNLLVCRNFDPTADPDTLFQEHRRWGETYDRVAPKAAHPNDRNPERRLRVGYVSPDFYRHAVSHFLEPIFNHHDPKQVEVYCYAEVSAPDAVTARFQARAHGWRWAFGKSDAEVVHQIRSDAIDILVDVAGHSAQNRLLVFTYKPAPIQITYVGYPNTTGLSAIDYRLTDVVADPPFEPVRHSEELVRLPLAFCYAPPDNAPAVTPLPALAAGHVTFGALHNLAKLNGRVLDLWAQLLHAVPSGRLVIFRNTLQGSARDLLHQQLTGRGISPERFDLLHQQEARTQHLYVYSSIDVSLDAFPWNGHTTACESLWMGVPVVALYGNRYGSRMAADVLGAVGLSELIASTPDRYVAIATQLAQNRDRLAELRSTLRERMRTSVLCDGPTFTRSLEDAYRFLWRRWCARRDG